MAEAEDKTLRDEFAMAALATLAATLTGAERFAPDVASDAYSLADAMMKARLK